MQIHHFGKYCFIGLTAALLSSCSYFKTTPSTSSQQEEGNIIVSTKDSNFDRGGDGLLQTEYPDMITMKTEGRVKVYPLEGEISQDNTGSREVPPDFAMHPNVEIFPIHGSPSHTAHFSPVMTHPSVMQVENRNQQNASINSYQNYAARNPRTIIYFSENSKSLNAEGLRKASQLVYDLDHSPARKIIIEGYASPLRNPGSAAAQTANLKISGERAQAVATVLIDSGIPASQIETRAMGDDSGITNRSDLGIPDTGNPDAPRVVVFVE